MITYGFVAVTGEAVDIASITAFAFGVGATLLITGLGSSIAILSRELATASPRAVMQLAARAARHAVTRGRAVREHAASGERAGRARAGGSASAAVA